MSEMNYDSWGIHHFVGGSYVNFSAVIFLSLLLLLLLMLKTVAEFDQSYFDAEMVVLFRDLWPFMPLTCDYTFMYVS